MKCSHISGVFYTNYPSENSDLAKQEGQFISGVKEFFGQKKTIVTENVLKKTTLHTESPQIKSLVVVVYLSDVQPCTSTSNPNHIPISNDYIKPHESALQKEGICYL